jgi:hypothetical protein
MLNATVEFHAWNLKGFAAPYQLLTILETPRPPKNPAFYPAWLETMNASQAAAKKLGVSLCSCYVCGQSLCANFVCQDSTGKRFVIGCDCATKLEDTKLITAVELATKHRDKAKREAKAEAERLARIAARNAQDDVERARNGGLTDYEVAEAARRAEREAERAAIREANAWVLSWLPEGNPGTFLSSMAYNLQSTKATDMSPRTRVVLCEIYAKGYGRTGSAKYEAAYDEAAAKLGVD